MKISKSDFGTTRSGAPVERFELTNDRGITVRLVSFGAILQSLEMPNRQGAMSEITLGFDDLASYEVEHPYFGATVGRYANRIAHGKFTLEGEEYTLATNNGPNHLHGGNVGFDKAVWSSETTEKEESAGVIFRHTSPDGDEGYPGSLAAEVTYLLDEDCRLTISYAATCDAPTVLNLTNHTYWNLAGAGSGVVYDHELTLSAEEYLPVDEGLIPTGDRVRVSGTPMDFTTMRTIGERLAEVEGGGYDHCYVLAGERRPEAVLAATVREPASGRVMRVLTTEPGIQLYTGNFLDGVSGANGKTFDKHGALCLEAQLFPDSPNQPSFPSSVLRPGETYRQTTVHEFTLD